MSDEVGFLNAIAATPDDELSRLAYADWLDDRHDPRADFIRLHLAMRTAEPDHIDWVAGEHELSVLRKGVDVTWLTIIEPERIPYLQGVDRRRYCGCFRDENQQKWPRIHFHREMQDTECDPWKRLLDLVETAAIDGREAFCPLRDMSLEQRSQILTLPASIAQLKAVKNLDLYGSSLVRIPPEIGEMTGLESFTPYTSYQLHWFPYEITRCNHLSDSTVSTRALYGNYKYNPPFPVLESNLAPPLRLPLTQHTPRTTRPCSVCGQMFVDEHRYRVWVSLRVATDELPLLVNACSDACVKNLSTPGDNAPIPHKGGRRGRPKSR